VSGEWFWVFGVQENAQRRTQNQKSNTYIDMGEEQKTIEERARARVEELKGFYIHLGIFIVIQVVLLAINLLTSPGSLWFLYPLMGWGIGLASHAISVFGLFGIGGRQWEERKVHEYMMRMGSGVDESEIRLMLDEEIDSRMASDQSNISLQRMVKRLENLEAIVTSRDWDLLDSTDDATQPSTARLELPEEDEAAAERAARLSRKVR